MDGKIAAWGYGDIHPNDLEDPFFTSINTYQWAQSFVKNEKPNFSPGNPAKANVEILRFNKVEGLKDLKKKMEEKKLQLHSKFRGWNIFDGVNKVNMTSQKPSRK